MITKKSISHGGVTADCYTLFDTVTAAEADILTLGARLVRLTAPDKEGVFENVVIGADDYRDYLKTPTYYGATIGRFANRIGGAAFCLDGTEYRLTKNESNNQLHGGAEGLHTKNWDAEVLGETLRLSCFSPDGEGGFPGNLNLSVDFTLQNNNLTIEYRAMSDRTTVLNLTNHAYFNLGGASCETILDHTLTILADFITTVDGELIPDGGLLDIYGTELACSGKPVGRGINTGHPLLEQCNGYDFNYCLSTGVRDGKSSAAQLAERGSGRRMDVFTDCPGLQLYTSNAPHAFPSVTLPRYRALCLETQGFPDAPNHPHFPSVRLEKDAPFYSKTVYAFNPDTIG